jgi:CubicO group peptidase (beta-lactamase class C family)
MRERGVVDLAGDMQSIERFVTEQLAAWEVLGCAAAAVQDGQVVLAAGWGQRDLDTKLSSATSPTCSR